MTLATLALAAFVAVAAKAFQQKNVTGNHWAMIPIGSHLLSACELFIIYNVAKSGPSVEAWLALGIAGTFGCWLAMWIHNRYVGAK